MNKEQAIELIQATRKGLSREQVLALIQGKAAGGLSEEEAVRMVLQILEVSVAPEPKQETLEERKKRMESEPERKGGVYLKPSTDLKSLGRKPEVGDMVLIKEVSVEPERVLKNGNVIPSRPLVKGVFIPKGTRGLEGEAVFVSLSESNERNLYKMWGVSLDRCIGMRLMIGAIQSKMIGGIIQVWFEWVGLPA